MDYIGDASSPEASLLEAKLSCHSVISNSHLGARFLTLDRKDFILQLKRPDTEYLTIHNEYFLDDIRYKYNIDPPITPYTYIYCKIKRDMYSLKQVVRLA